jgi:hypothetical protein
MFESLLTLFYRRSNLSYGTVLFRHRRLYQLVGWFLDVHRKLDGPPFLGPINSSSRKLKTARGVSGSRILSLVKRISLAETLYSVKLRYPGTRGSGSTPHLNETEFVKHPGEMVARMCCEGGARVVHEVCL